MKRNILSFGLISGLVLIIFILLLTFVGKSFQNATVGYTFMVIAFSFIYVGIRNFRDKYNSGVISFGKALRIGLGIALIGSTVYVITWLIAYYGFMPDFMDHYVAGMIKQARAEGLTGAALDKKIAGIKQMGEWYKNPGFVVLTTYAEILPVGIVISLFAALILKRKSPGASYLRQTSPQHA
jgi:hypothetical protein